MGLNKSIFQRVSTEKKWNPDYLFRIEIPCRGDTVLNQSVSTERSIPIRPDSVFQVRKMPCQSEVKIQPLTSIVDSDLHRIPRYSIVTYIFHCYVQRVYKHIIVYAYFRVFFNQSRCSGDWGFARSDAPPDTVWSLCVSTEILQGVRLGRHVKIHLPEVDLIIP